MSREDLNFELKFNCEMRAFSRILNRSYVTLASLCVLPTLF